MNLTIQVIRVRPRKARAGRAKTARLSIQTLELLKMNEYIFSALIFGLTAGFKPGPLGIIVIQQTLEHGLSNGIKASLAPIITDGPIILCALIMLSQFKDINNFIGSLSLIGGSYLLFLSIKQLKLQVTDLNQTHTNQNSLALAIKVNLLSPYPYLFWFTVGGSYIALGTKTESIVFVAVAIATLVLSKMTVALITNSFKEFLYSNSYLWLMHILGVLLAVFGILLLSRGYHIWFG